MKQPYNPREANRGYRRNEVNEELRRAIDNLETDMLHWRNSHRIETLKCLAENPYCTSGVLGQKRLQETDIEQLEFDFVFSPCSDGLS